MERHSELIAQLVLQVHQTLERIQVIERPGASGITVKGGRHKEGRLEVISLEDLQHLPAVLNEPVVKSQPE